MCNQGVLILHTIMTIVERQYDVSAVLGLGGSDMAILTARILSLYQIPSLGIWATCDTLSDKSKYEYFVRTVPPDRFQVQTS